MDIEQRLIEGLNSEKEDALNAGMKLLTIGQLKDYLNLLDCHLEFSFNYTNTANKNIYKATSYHIVDNKTKQWFGNIAFPNKYYKEIQELRFNTFCIHRGRLLEI